MRESPITPWGADSDLIKTSTTTSPPPSYSLPSLACQKMVRFFQVYISPIDGPRSHYHPTSSQYTLEAIRRYGVFTGIALGCDRLMRENKEKWVYPLVELDDIRKVDLVR